MSSIIELAKGQFGKTVKWVTGGTEKTMSGEIKDYALFIAQEGIDLDAVILKHKREDMQGSEERKEDFPAYIMVSPDVLLLEDDIIKTNKEIFVVKEPSLRHDNITGSVGDDPSYMRAELSLWGKQ